MWVIIWLLYRSLWGRVINFFSCQIVFAILWSLLKKEIHLHHYFDRHVCLSIRLSVLRPSFVRSCITPNQQMLLIRSPWDHPSYPSPGVEPGVIPGERGQQAILYINCKTLFELCLEEDSATIVSCKKYLLYGAVWSTRQIRMTLFKFGQFYRPFGDKQVCKTGRVV